MHELSVEVLLLHDHAVLLHNRIQAAGLASSPSLTDHASPLGGVDKTVLPAEAPKSTPLPGPGSAIDPVSPESQPRPTVPIFHSESLPRLSRLIRARGENNPGRPLVQSRSEVAIKDGRSHTVARARPQSAGSARRGAPASGHLLSSIVGGGRGNSGASSKTRRRESTRYRETERFSRNRPMSAPGQRSSAQAGDKRSEQRGEEWGEGGGEGGHGVAVGWSNRDEIFRDAAELSMKELLSLVRRLRERVGERGSRFNYCRAVVDSKREEGRGRDNAQDLLRDQARRYNELRVAYQSLSRRLEKGRRGREGGGADRSVRNRMLFSSVSAKAGVKMRGVVGRSGAPETNLRKGILLGDEVPIRDRIRVG